MPTELPQRPLPAGMGPGLIRRISSAAWSDRVLASLGIDVLRLGRLLPVTYSLSSLSWGFPSLFVRARACDERGENNDHTQDRYFHRSAGVLEVVECTATIACFSIDPSPFRVA